MEPEPERGLSSRKSSQMSMDTKGMIVGVVAAVITSVLALLNEHRSRTRRPRITRQPYIYRDSLRKEIINSVLYCGDTHCLGQIRMRPQAFFSLCNILDDKRLLKENIRIGVEEQELIFLYILGHNGTKEEMKVHFRWSKNMSKELLELLAEEVRKGNRPNNTFQTSSFIAATKVISEKFQVNCTPEHVENHMKTVRNTWATISIVRNNSGFGWSNNLMMITTSPTAYDTYIKQYPAHEKYLNRKIDLYDEMAIVVGKDMARGNFSMTFGDIDVDATIESGQPSMTIESIPSKAESGTSLDSRSRRKRSRNDEEGCDMGKNFDQLQEVVSALTNFFKQSTRRGEALRRNHEVDIIKEAVRVVAFDHLVEREMLAKAFLTKSTHLRKLWFEKFVKSLF
ncbi:L10-interacting MYB domain-containing protein [Bienertia sinuspersici]